jgi:hypothetical protein
MHSSSEIGKSRFDLGTPMPPGYGIAVVPITPLALPIVVMINLIMISIEARLSRKDGLARFDRIKFDFKSGTLPRDQSGFR